MTDDELVALADDIGRRARQLAEACDIVRRSKDGFLNAATRFKRALADRERSSIQQTEGQVK